jgi:threonine dehydratase
LNGGSGLRLVCKVETVNPIRSFKGRGTYYQLRPSERGEAVGHLGG